MKEKVEVSRMCFRTLTGICFWMTFFLPSVFASVEEKAVREGNRLYRQEKYDQALGKYNQALVESPDSPIVGFNQGAAHYKKGDYEAAADSFTRALAVEDSRMEARAAYNLGNCKFKQGKLKEDADPAAAVDLMRESLDYYKRALELDEKDVAAKYNHELVERYLKELLDKLQQQQEQGKAEQEKAEEEKEQQTQPQPQPSPAEQKEEEEKKEPSEKRTPEPEDTEELKEEVRPAETGEEEERPEQMSEKEARMLLEGYQQEEEAEREEIKTRPRRFPDVIKDW